MAMHWWNKLTSNDRDAIMNGQRLDDLVINLAQKILKMQFPSVKGFQSTLLQEKKRKSNLKFKYCIAGNFRRNLISKIQNFSKILKI